MKDIPYIEIIVQNNEVEKKKKKANKGLVTSPAFSFFFNFLWQWCWQKYMLFECFLAVQVFVHFWVFSYFFSTCKAWATIKTPNLHSTKEDNICIKCLMLNLVSVNNFIVCMFTSTLLLLTKKTLKKNFVTWIKIIIKKNNHQ